MKVKPLESTSQTSGLPLGNLFIAGGIGMTPFRSMAKYLLDKNEHRDITVFYSGKTPQDLVYEDIFARARDKLGIPTFTTVTQAASGWSGATGYINEAMIKQKLPDYRQRMFYISGPLSIDRKFPKNFKRYGRKRQPHQNRLLPRVCVS